MALKGIKWASGLYLLMFIADLTSTLINGELVKHLESNPLYNHLGIVGIALLNLGVVAACYYGYQYSTRNDSRHAFIMSLVTISILRIFIVYNNIQAYLNPLPLEVAAAIPQAVKTKYYVRNVVSPIILSLSTGLLSFLLFQKDHKIEVQK